MGCSRVGGARQEQGFRRRPRSEDVAEEGVAKTGEKGERGESDLQPGHAAGDGLERLTVTSLRDKARRAIRAGIIAGNIEAGGVVSVRTLAGRLGVSATPVREAMLDLAKDGLLVPIRNKGFRVPMPSDTDLQNIVDLRLLLEVPSLMQLAGKLPAERVGHHRAAADAVRAAAAEGDVVGFLEGDREFHLALLAELGNPRLVDLVALLRDQVRLYGVPQLAEENQLTGSAGEHVEILDAIEGGDAGRVRLLMSQHLEHIRGIWAR
jgi:DNA-binding GntR family transcriptional regulator